jgi:hypothetical protein
MWAMFWNNALVSIWAGVFGFVGLVYVLVYDLPFHDEPTIPPSLPCNSPFIQFIFDIGISPFDYCQWRITFRLFATFLQPE